MKTLIKIQLGKQGITENFIETLKSNFKNHYNVRISVLKNVLSEDENKKEKIKEFSEIILEKLGMNYTSKIVGFTINVKKWRKPIRGIN